MPPRVSTRLLQCETPFTAMPRGLRAAPFLDVVDLQLALVVPSDETRE